MFPQRATSVGALKMTEEQEALRFKQIPPTDGNEIAFCANGQE